ncbi:C40 family peptidase [Roseibium polysiphoniae]|uniref:C40 family peptidase n=1 Tax=Roseibium polysiphoniae TaxID=2571221 RepID=A0ABR9CEJ5_9HYPH|nr:NlpC/P60 family protein [Roseibium polysiphoniae]MBD8878309.1 C40 family peptidase [Roseibium polysiphoniae]
MPIDLDRRLHPVRSDLAASGYEDRVVAERFVPGAIKIVTADYLDMRPAPELQKPIDSQALHGEVVTVFEETDDGWSWGQLETDGYVGWILSEGLGAHHSSTHQVSSLRTYRYPVADLKFPPLGLISIGAHVSVVGRKTTRGLDYAILSDGSAVVARHLMPLGETLVDWVGVAEQFIGTPYRWGGRTSLGLDCSALVQLSASFAGHTLLRDSDMQEKDAGVLLSDVGLSDLQRGDLVFWKGHVGIIQEKNRLLHASGHTMIVSSEPLDKAVERISKNEWGAVTTLRRL